MCSRATIQQKIQALDYYEQHNSSQNDTVNHFKRLNQFKISKSSFNRWLINSKSIRDSYKTLTPTASGHYKKLPNYRSSKVDQCLYKWYFQKVFQNIMVSEAEIVSKWNEFAAMLGEEQEHKSNGWIYHFKKKYLTKKKLILDWLNLIDALNRLSFAQDLSRLQSVINRCEMCNVFCLDEVVVSSRIQPGSSYNSSFIVMICMNYDQSEYIEPFIIGTEDVQPGEDADYLYTKTGLLTDDIFYNYLFKWNEKLVASGRKIVLFVDCLYQHVVPQLSNIQIEYYNPKFQTFHSKLFKLTSFYELESQPLNLGIIKLFKLLFKISLCKTYYFNYLTMDEETADVDKLHIDNNQIIELILKAFNDLKKFKHETQLCFDYNSRNTKEMRKQPYLNKLQESLIKLLKLLQLNSIIKQSNYSMEQLLFPSDEFMVNTFYNDDQIVSIAKLESSTHEQVSVDSQFKPIFNPEIEKNSIKSLNSSLQQISRFLYNSNLNHEASKSLFNKFYNSLIDEIIEV